MQLDRDWIAARIPHHGNMCLLERVVSWNEQGISCIAISHRAPDNPLRAHGRLAGVCGIEYAAQAMAVHGALREQLNERPQLGLLVSVRGVRLHVGRLDDVPANLLIEARHFSGDGNHVLYDFNIHADDRILLEGRAAVIINAARDNR